MDWHCFRIAVFIQTIKSKGIKTGVSLNPHTSVHLIKDIIIEKKSNALIKIGVDQTNTKYWLIVVVMFLFAGSYIFGANNPIKAISNKTPISTIHVINSAFYRF